MAIFSSGVGTKALLNDANAQQILRNRSSLSAPGRTAGIGTLATTRQTQGYVPLNVTLYQRQLEEMQPTTVLQTSNPKRQSFISPVTGGQAGMLMTAKQFLGTPYRWGGTDPNKGWDCSGFTQFVAKQNGQKIPRTASSQYQWFAKNGRLSTDINTAKPGDLLSFQSKSSPSGWHTGIYIGNGKMIDAAGKKSGPKISNIGGRKLRGIGRMS